MDGDGDLDLVAGNYGQANRLYLNNGTADPFNGVTGTDISAIRTRTTAIALGDVDGDGDLDLVAGNYGQANRLYLNNGTADPFSGVTGTDISADAHNTMSIALGDVDGDGDLDLVAGNSESSQPPVPEQRHGRSLQRCDRTNISAMPTIPTRWRSGTWTATATWTWWPGMTIKPTACT